VALIGDVQRCLLTDSKSQLLQFHSQGILVDLFEKSLAQEIVNLESAADDLLSQS
jgi:hypothetical protein